MSKAVYIHIPFCEHICSYCDFCKFLYNEKWVYAYLKALEFEIKDRYMDDEISTIYIGGGTPSCLRISEIKKLMEIISIFKIPNLEEFTFECNIADITPELLSVLRDYGVTRLSIGIESFNRQKLEFMERHADFKNAQSKIKLCHDYGFENINLDLIYAIPNESLKVLKKDIDLLLKLKPTHISTYSLEINEHTKLAIDDAKYISDELDYNMFCLIEKKLSFMHHYEISNFALPGYESKHNLVYWNNLEYYGFGLGASGYIDEFRYTNTKNLKKYLLGEYVAEKEFVTKTAKMDYEVMLGLRKLDGININDFKNKYGLDIEDAYNIKPLIKSKDLIMKKGYIYINPAKIYVMNEILLKII
jgi:oxygen-independent coproporphyrinogen-3 oxidase